MKKVYVYAQFCGYTVGYEVYDSCRDAMERFYTVDRSCRYCIIKDAWFGTEVLVIKEGACIERKVFVGHKSVENGEAWKYLQQLMHAIGEADSFWVTSYDCILDR